MKAEKQQERKITRFFKSYYFVYTVVFLCFFFVAFAAFLINKKSLVWRTDGMLQHYPNMVYLRTWVKQLLNNIFVQHTLDIPMWDMTIGEGSNILNAISFRPLMWLSLLAPRKYLEQYCWVRTAFSMYLSGITFSCFCAKFKRLDFSCLLGSITYVFSGFLLYYASKHEFFIEFTICFPLILLGTEKILRKESNKVFIVTVALVAMSYFYMLYMLTVFAVIYAIVRYGYIYKFKDIINLIKTLFKFLLYYLIGLGIAAIALMPSLMLALSSSRAGDISTSKLSVFYNVKYYLEWITSLMATTEVAANSGGVFALSALTVIFVFEIVFREKSFSKKELQLKIMVLLGMLFCLSPVFSAAFNGFAAVTYRWSFVFSFGGGLIVAFTFSDYFSKNQKREICARSYVAIALYGLTCLCLNFIYKTESRQKYFIFLLTYICIYLILSSGKRSRSGLIICQIAVAFVLLLEVGVKAYTYYNSLSDYIDTGTVDSEVVDVAASAMENITDDSVYRVDSLELTPYGPYLNRNYGFRTGVNGISFYASYTASSLVETIKDLGVCNPFMSFGNSSYDQRTVLDTLSAVKYVTTPEFRIPAVPYGYVQIGEYNGISVFENENALPIIYAYDSYIPEDEYDVLSVNRKEQAMLQGAVFDAKHVDECELQFDDKVVLSKEDIYAQWQDQLSGQDKIEDDGIYCEKGKSFTLTLPEKTTGEIYLLFDGLEYSPVTVSEQGHNSGEIHVEMVRDVAPKAGYKMCYAFGKLHQYYNGPKDILLNVGYFEDCDSTITVTFTQAGKFLFSDVRVVVQPMTEYSGYVEKLRVPVKNITVNGDHIYAGFTLDKPRIVCVAVPYEDGWTAMINGVQTEIQKVNGRYIGFELPAGEYKIVLRYRIPGLFAGAAISFVTLLILAAVYLVREVRIQKAGRCVGKREGQSDRKHLYKEK